MRQGSENSILDCEISVSLSACWCSEPARSAFESAKRSADQYCPPKPINVFRVASLAASAAVLASPVKTFNLLSFAKSITWSPIATPPRKASSDPLRRNSANGKF